jgi:hypothetical protein
MSLLLLFNAGAQSAALSVSGIIIPERSTEEGILVKSTSLVWTEIVEVLGNDWSVAYQIAPEKWEEIVASAFNKAQYEVTLTRRRRGHNGKLTRNVSVYGDASYLGSIAGEQRITIKGNAGLRVTW